ncbi:fungal-specific transcription factor domain-containing protein [Coniochaeta sp. 2T2.1]|nr:fungal-specific transcription factor domain-containing protein [Coniochaeta sp. 2T2.1]
METCDGKRIHQSTRKRRACDRCVRQKKACNAASPCENCQKRAVSCQYSYLGSGGEASSTSGTDAADAADDSTVVEPISYWAANGTSDMTSTAVSATPITSIAFPTNQLGVQYGDIWNALVQETVSDFNLIDSHVAGMIRQEWPGFMSPTLQPTPARPVYEPDVVPYQGYTFQFLADFTSRTGLVSSFDCGTLAQRRQVVSSFLAANLELASPIPTLSPSETAGLAVQFHGSDGDPESSPPDFPVFDSGWQSWLDNPMVLKLQQIIIRIKEVVVIKPRNSTVTLSWSPALEARCLNFFSVSRFGKFLELYWSVWHPNVNFLHRPTFDPVNTPTTLLAAMAIIGASVSPDDEDNEDARMWYNCVEEMVFTDDILCSDTLPYGLDEHAATSSISALRRKLQALQAACIVCLYQNWEGTDSSKRRIRRYRFGTVVSVARDIGLSNAKHANYYNIPEHQFHWEDYVAREELIRTFLWIMLIDTAFVIFNNLPHRMVIKEMTMHMASPESCFQASTSEDCLDQIRQWMPDSTAMCNITLRQAIESLCVKTLSPESQLRMAELGPLNMFAIISGEPSSAPQNMLHSLTDANCMSLAFHYMIFQHQNLTVVEGQLTPIRNALGNWKNIWVTYCAHCPPTALDMDSGDVDTSAMWKRIGFSRYCAEYWLLATLLVGRISGPSTQQHQLGGPDTGDGGGELGHARLVEPVLDKYDQTSMAQVNELITNFRDFQL